MKTLRATIFGLLLAGSLALADSFVTVQQGDTLGGIAARYGVSVAALQKLNGLSNQNIRVGQSLKLPSTAGITVQAGDSLAGIAARHGVSVEALRTANGISGDRIRVGQSLKLPNGNTPRASASQANKPTNTSTRASTRTITIEPGDSLAKIAQRNGVTVEALRAANNLTDDRIRAGQTLQLPSNKPNNTKTTSTQAAKPNSSKPTANAAKPSNTPQTVEVQKGDTLQKIAQRNGVSIADLRAANKLTSDTIRVGETLRLRPVVVAQKPNSSKPTASATKPKPNAAKPTASKPKPSTANTAKPKPTAKPTTASTKPTAKPSNATKPTASSKPSTNTSKPTTSSKPAPNTSASSKPNPASNQRVIAPPPNLPTATGAVVTVKPVAKPTVKPTTARVPSKPTTPTASAKPKPDPVTSVKPTPTVSTPQTAPTTAKPQPSTTAAPTTAKPTTPRSTSTPTTAAVKPTTATAIPNTITPTIPPINEPLEAPVSSEPALIDPALESPFFDATAPDAKPTTPSDLLPEGTVLEIPEEQPTDPITFIPDSTPPVYSRSERVLWPISGIMTSRFGWRRLGRTRFHTGIDLAAPRGTRVYAALSGRVEFAGWNRQGYGYLVIIRGWDNRQYYYGHNSRLLVRRGQWVRQGQNISRVGSTGFSTGPHLHFEIRVAKRARNPLAYLPSSRLALASSRR